MIFAHPLPETTQSLHMKRIGCFEDHFFTWDSDVSNLSQYINGCDSSKQWLKRCKERVESRDRQFLGKVVYWLIYFDFVRDDLGTLLCDYLVALMRLGQDPDVKCIRYWDDAWWEGTSQTSPSDVCMGQKIFMFMMKPFGTATTARTEDVQTGFDAYKARLSCLMPGRDREGGVLYALYTLWYEATNYLSRCQEGVVDTEDLDVAAVYHGRAFGTLIFTCISFARFMRIVTFRCTPLHLMRWGVELGNWETFAKRVEERAMDVMLRAWFRSLFPRRGLVEVEDVHQQARGVTRAFEVYNKMTSAGHERFGGVQQADVGGA